MKVVLIYSTKPKPAPLAFVADISDAQLYIQTKLTLAETRVNAAKELMEREGGAVSITGLERWQSAQCIEIDINYELPPVRRVDEPKYGWSGKELDLPTP